MSGEAHRRRTQPRREDSRARVQKGIGLLSIYFSQQRNREGAVGPGRSVTQWGSLVTGLQSLHSTNHDAGDTLFTELLAADLGAFARKFLGSVVRVRVVVIVE